jgi:lipid-A-disaccharide synthase
VTVNGPGETAGWLRPLAAAIARGAPTVSMTTVVTPCQLASGRESAVIAQLAGVSHVERLGPYLRQAAARRVTGARRAGPPLVLHLGGDPVYALLIAWVLGAAAWTYGTSARYRNSFERFLVPDERTASKLRTRGVAARCITVVGQLVTDSVQAGRHTWAGSTGGEPTVVFLAGSRQAQVEFMVPYYAAVVERVHASGCRMRSLLLASPFVSLDLLASGLSEAGWAVVPRNGTFDATSPLGPALRIIRCGVEDLGGVDLAVTIPGTNTLQLAALGVPHLVVTPGQRAELIAFTGPLGLLKPTWWGAAAIRRAALHRLSRQLPYLAIPNIIAGAEIVPEMRNAVEPPDVAVRVTQLLAAADMRREMSARLRAVAGPTGAADRVVALMLHQERPSCTSVS